MNTKTNSTDCGKNSEKNFKDNLGGQMSQLNCLNLT